MLNRRCGVVRLLSLGPFNVLFARWLLSVWILVVGIPILITNVFLGSIANPESIRN